MHASAILLFLATALAAPSLHNHHLHLHAGRQLHDDIAYKTVIVTQYVTALAASGTGNVPQEQSSSTECTSSTAAPLVVAPSQSDAAASGSTEGTSPAAVMSGSSSISGVAAVSASPIAAPPSSLPSSILPSSASSAASSAAAPSSSEAGPSVSGSYPFKNIVIFGDNLSDRGNGSSDHNVAGNPETIYGFKTWTDGLIAAEQLANDMKLPIIYDFAFGHADGGSKFGATIDNTFTQSDAQAPAVCDQIKNYTGSGYYNKASVAQTLHFVWGGNNDVIPWINHPKFHPFPEWGLQNGMNQQFCTDLANLITTQAKTLTDAGAEHVFVPNIYPRHVAPVVQRYFSNDTNWVNTYGEIISQVNSNLKTNLATLSQQTGTKITYYDAYGFLLNLYNAALQSGVGGFSHMQPGDNICDGSFVEPIPGVSSLEYCNTGHGNQYFWMQYLDMTAHVDSLLAQDMQKALGITYGIA